MCHVLCVSLLRAQKYDNHVKARDSRRAPTPLTDARFLVEKRRRGRYAGWNARPALRRRVSSAPSIATAGVRQPPSESSVS